MRLARALGLLLLLPFCLLLLRSCSCASRSESMTIAITYVEIDGVAQANVADWQMWRMKITAAGNSDAIVLVDAPESLAEAALAGEATPQVGPFYMGLHTPSTPDPKKVADDAACPPSRLLPAVYVRVPNWNHVDEQVPATVPWGMADELAWSIDGWLRYRVADHIVQARWTYLATPTKGDKDGPPMCDTDCLFLGRCHPLGDVCEAQSDEECAASVACLRDGRCRASGGMCHVDILGCVQSSRCHAEGRCQANLTLDVCQLGGLP